MDAREGEPGVPVPWALALDLHCGISAIRRICKHGHGTTDWFQIGKGVCQGCILSPCLFNLYAEYIMRNTGLKKHKLESRLLGEISITSDTQMTPPSWLPGRKTMKNLDSKLKSRDITLATKVQCSQSYGVSSSHEWMDHKEI